MGVVYFFLIRQFSPLFDINPFVSVLVSVKSLHEVNTLEVLSDLVADCLCIVQVLIGLRPFASRVGEHHPFISRDDLTQFLNRNSKVRCSRFGAEVHCQKASGINAAT